MSSSPLVVLMALTSFLILPGGSIQNVTPDSVSNLLLQDDVEQAEVLLDRQSKTSLTTALKGEIEYRKGNFDKAQALYDEALRMDTGTARAHLGLSKLAIAKLQGNQAVTEILRAIELDPKVPLYRLYASEAYAVQKNYVEQRKQLEEYVRLSPATDDDRLAEAKAGIELIDAFGDEEIARVEGPESPAPVRFGRTLNLIFSNIMINGMGPYNFAIDTGATQTVLSQKLAADLGLAPITTTIMHGIGGSGKIESKMYRLDEIAIGDMKVRNVPAGTFADPLLSQLADGILGTAMLSDFIITINYPKNQMELSRKKTAADASSETLPAWYFSNLLLVPLEVNGNRGNFIVDTGAVTTVLSHSMASKLGVNERTPGARVDLGIVGVGGFEAVVLQVPNVTIKTPNRSEQFAQVVSIDLKQISKMLGTEVSGVVGYDFLQDYQLTLDYYGTEVRLTKPAN